MNPDDLEPLDPEVARLLEAERRGPDPAPAAQARVFAHLARTISALPAVAPGGSTFSQVRRGLWSSPKAIGAAASLFAAGGAVGASLHAVLVKPPPARVVYLPAPTPAAPPAPAAPGANPTEPAVPAAPERKARRPHAAPAPASPQPEAVQPPAASPAAPESDTSLASERALIEVARTALTRGSYVDALRYLQRHAERFPRGRLAEEREALAIQALVALKDYPQARARAAEFHKDFPRSLLGPAVDEVLRSIP